MCLVLFTSILSRNCIVKALAGSSPKEQAEDGEGADVDATAAQGTEDAAAEPGHEEDGALPEPEVGDRVVRLALVLPEEEHSKLLAVN